MERSFPLEPLDPETADTDRPPPDLVQMVAGLTETVNKVYSTVNKVHRISKDTQKVAFKMFADLEIERKRISELEADVQELRRKVSVLEHDEARLAIVRNGAGE